MAVRAFIAALAAVSLAGCSTFKSTPGIGDSVSWQQLPGWQQDQQLEAWPALLSQCQRLASKEANWQQICASVQTNPPTSDAQARAFFEQHFEPHFINGQDTREGLITGYFEPLLNGSRNRSERYNYPLYKRPADLLKTAPEANLPAVSDSRARARQTPEGLMPYYSRAEIDGVNQPLAGNEIVWVDDADAAFFLHIQGSGRVLLDTGEVIGVGYADQNGHPYLAIGKVLIERGEVEREKMSLQAIQQWLDDNPEGADELKNQNASYIFFTERPDTGEGPRGSLNVPLTGERSVAIDRKIIPLGTPLWLDTELPDESGYQRLVMAQDTGGAIVGPVRADVFFGRGDRAKELAGTMKQRGRLYALLPKQHQH